MPSHWSIQHLLTYLIDNKTDRALFYVQTQMKDVFLGDLVVSTMKKMDRLSLEAKSSTTHRQNVS